MFGLMFLVVIILVVRLDFRCVIGVVIVWLSLAFMLFIRFIVFLDVILVIILRHLIWVVDLFWMYFLCLLVFFLFFGMKEVDDLVQSAI
jgi:hypothetical protein